MLEKIGLPAKPAARGNNWVVDASHCQGCSSQFTFINRKHHCRRCGGLFCNSCTQQRMVLRGQGDSPVRICEPCKKLEEAARFERRYGHKNKTGRGGPKLTYTNEEEVLNQILGSERKELMSTTSMVSGSQKDLSRASSSTIQELTTYDDGEEISQSPSVEETSQPLAESGSASPEELRQKALDEKKKYKILKAEGKSDEALRAFKRGKELEREAGALELLIRKNRRKGLSSSNTTEIQKITNESTYSGRKTKTSPQESKEKDNLSAELKELGWSDMDLHDVDKKAATMTLEGELSTLLGEVSQKNNKEKGSRGIEKSQVIAHKKRALTLKREGNLAEAKEELKKAKILEKQLEEEEFFAEAEDSDDELSALIRSIDNDKQDNLLDASDPDAGFDFDHVMGITDDLGVNSNFEVTDEDLDDPEISAALKSLGWADEAEHLVDSEPQFAPVDKEALFSEIQSLKREALNQKRAGNTAEALELLKKAKTLEKDLDNQVENPAKTSNVDLRNVNGMDKADPKLAPKSKLMIQKELLALKKRALTLRREGKVEEANKELEKGKLLEQQLEEMDNASTVKATKVSVSNRHTDNIAVPDLGDEEEEDVTDQDLHDPTYLALLSSLGWKEEDDKDVGFTSKPAKQNVSPMQEIDSSVAEAASFVHIGASRRSKAEIQRELLGLKRKALALRRQGKTDEAEEVLQMTKVLEAQLAEMEVPKKESESNKHEEGEIISSPNESPVGDKRFVSEEDMQDAALVPVLKNLEGTDEFEPTAVQQKSSDHIARISACPIHTVNEDMGNAEKITCERREEIVQKDQKPHISDSDSVQATVSQNDRSPIRQEILLHKRKAVALKREGKLAEAREELRQAKLLEKSLEDDNAHPGTSSTGISGSTPNVNAHPRTSSSGVSSSTSNVTFVVQKENGPSNLASKPLSSRDRFKLQQESLSHKRLALKLRREGRTEEAEAEFELAKALEAQLEESAANDSAKSSLGGAKADDDIGVEDFLDPQLMSALKAIGIEDASTLTQAPNKSEPVKPVAGKGENSVGEERIQLEEQIKAERVKAVTLKRSGKQAEALDALRRAKMLEKRLNSLAS